MIDKGSYIEMHLSNRGIVKFDKEDFDKIDKHLWFATQTNGGIYARRKWTEEDTTRFKTTRETFALHNEKMDFLPGKDESGEFYSIDHKDRDTLNNRRGNLRKASAKMQAENRDRKPGVTKQKNITIESNKPCYRLRITVDKKRKNAYFYYSDYGGMPGALAEVVRCRDIIIEKLKDKSISKEVSEGKKTLRDLID